MQFLNFPLLDALAFPIQNPVLVFTIVLFIIFIVPILLNSVKIPPLIGLIIAGAVIGPNGFNILEREGGVELLGTVGLIYIMFLAGLEIDMADFKKNSRKGFVFGMYTFLIPMALGIAGGLFLLGFSPLTSILLASMFASHTPLTYPIISQYGITNNRAVGVTLGGTMITDTLALLVLAIVVEMTTGDIGTSFWVRLIISLAIFSTIVSFLIPYIGRWFFKMVNDKTSQYIFVLFCVFISAFMAQVAGVEAIIGAFLAGLALNRLVPNTSPLMNRVEFVGNSLFIPFFLISVGMLVDFKLFIADTKAIIVAGFMTFTAALAKFVAAWLTQKTFRFTADERRIIFGLSNSQAAATLAVVLVGFNVIIGETDQGVPIRLLDENILNGSILMIFITCTISTFVTQKGAHNIARETLSGNETDKPDEKLPERVLVTISHPDTIEELVNLSITTRASKNAQFFGLNVISRESIDPVSEAEARKSLQKATKIASATDTYMKELLRYDLNVVNGITNVVKERKITDIFMGLHKDSKFAISLFGSVAEGLLLNCQATIFIYRTFQPLATIARGMVIIPPDAEKEHGFRQWLARVWKLTGNTGMKVVFFGTPATLEAINKIYPQPSGFIDFREYEDYKEILVLLSEVGPNDCPIVIMSRENAISYHPEMPTVPKYLKRYLKNNSYIIIYPGQQLPGEGGENGFDPIMESRTDG